jgi:hypothetical protein
MKTQLKLMLLMIAVPLIVFTGCKKNDLPAGAKKISGIGYLDAKDACNSAGQGAVYALTMTGDLEGCLYVFIDEFSCTDGNYLEKGRELFVGTYKGKSGSFRTTYDFQAKYEGCNPDGSYAGAEISGQCQHYIVKGSGTGCFTGVTGRIDFIDNVKADPIDYPYLGYFKF